ncbi:hypothetical protein ACJIZ3_010694 [Penstemon smallii]|uniref:Uncharacterized protein n=1 Tax=Penstemon smallii TaxID=265156 RepID=A0ABD3UKP7_9LAMI
MAALSPVKSITTSAAAVGTPSGSNASRSLRGLNKPKCIKCGNVARSRCPYQSCKNCCAKAENPCHIHVLKGNSSFPDKAPSSSSPLFEQQSTDTSHSGSSQRLRQLSNNFSQFSNLQTPIRARKPLTRKDAQVINEWRFLKLKESRDANMEAETEAFDRYMQNVTLLEDIFSVNSAPNEQIQNEKSSETTVQGLVLKLRSNTVRTENFKKRIQYIIDHKLRKLEKFELVDDTNELSDTEGDEKKAKKFKSSQGERTLALTDLSDKLNKARNEEDLKACWEMASQIFGWNSNARQTEPCRVLLSGEMDPDCDLSTEKRSYCFPPKWVTPGTIDEEVLSRLDAQFSSLEEIEDL